MDTNRSASGLTPDPDRDRDTVLEPELNASTYQWSVRLFSVVRKMLRVHLALHGDKDGVALGDIFLFNHFARFETFIPQYLIFEETGAYCRSVAAAELFTNDAFGSYLRGVGAVPNDHPQLLALLARDILRGRKIVFFPEGGMVKDRRVVDERGRYSVYSRTAGERRKHHTGAAVLALYLDAFKEGVKRVRREGNFRRLDAWAERLGLESVDALLLAVSKPTAIVPANITFYPIRVSDNLLRKGAELFSRGLTRRHSEELLIEGNLLLKDTDMDIRLGRPVFPERRWCWWDRALFHGALSKADGIGDYFAPAPARKGWESRFLARRVRRYALRVRDDYMHRMYMGVTVNLSHLASRLVCSLVEAGQSDVPDRRFHRMLYHAVKHAQRQADVHLHRSLRDPDSYGPAVDGRGAGYEQFLRTAGTMGLITRLEGAYRLEPKLRKEHAFDAVRLENLIEVYSNEVAPLAAVRRAVATAIDDAASVTPRGLAELRYDDMLLGFEFDRQAYDQPKHREINRAETATGPAAPYLLLPPAPRSLGIVLVHGFLSSPEELRSYGEKLAAAGRPVIGARLKGHGTSPWDLRDRRFEDWLASVEQAYAVMRELAARVALVGFSTGGSLALLLASRTPEGLAGVCAVSVPMKFQDQGMKFVPLVHGANRVVRWMSSYEGVMPFRQHRSEHPQINYLHMPIRGLYELHRLVSELQSRLAAVRCPVALLQATRDPVVVPDSVDVLAARLNACERFVTMIPSDRHGILNEDVGETQNVITAFLEALERGDSRARPAD